MENISKNDQSFITPIKLQGGAKASVDIKNGTLTITTKKGEKKTYNIKFGNALISKMSQHEKENIVNIVRIALGKIGHKLDQKDITSVKISSSKSESKVTYKGGRLFKTQEKLRSKKTLEKINEHFSKISNPKKESPKTNNREKKDEFPLEELKMSDDIGEIKISRFSEKDSESTHNPLLESKTLHQEFFKDPHNKINEHNTFEPLNKHEIVFSELPVPSQETLEEEKTKNIFTKFLNIENGITFELVKEEKINPPQKNEEPFIEKELKPHNVPKNSQQIIESNDSKAKENFEDILLSYKETIKNHEDKVEIEKLKKAKNEVENFNSLKKGFSKLKNAEINEKNSNYYTTQIISIIEKINDSAPLLFSLGSSSTETKKQLSEYLELLGSLKEDKGSIKKLIDQSSELKESLKEAMKTCQDFLEFAQENIVMETKNEKLLNEQKKN